MALLALPACTSGGISHEGFVVSQVGGVHEYHWVRITGVDAVTGSPSAAALEAAPSLQSLLGGSGALGHVLGRLRAAPSTDTFLADLQEVLERLAYGSSAGPGPGSTARPSGMSSSHRVSATSSSSSSSSSSCRLLQLLLRDLDSLGWGCLEELDQEAARLTLLHRDACGREHRLRLSLPPHYPAAPPAAATDLPLPLVFSWREPPSQQGAGHQTWRVAGQQQHHNNYQDQQPGPRREEGGACSSIADVYSAFTQAVSSCQLLWACLDDIDRRTRVFDPPPSVSAARRHLGPPARRLALGGAASLQLRLDPADPRGPPPLAGGVTFLGPPDAVAAMREALFGRMHLWCSDRDPVDNLELLLGQQLPQPSGGSGTGAVGSGAAAVAEAALHEAECPICLMHVLPVGGDAEAGGADGGSPAGGHECGNGGATADGQGNGGLVPDVVCPTPACGLAFHAPCLAEWLRSLPDTRVSFSKLFGRCPFCSNPITVRA